MEDKRLIWRVLDPKKVEGAYGIIRASEAMGEIVPVHRIAIGRKEALIEGAVAMHEEEDSIRIYFPVYDVSHSDEGFGSDTVLNMQTACLIAEFEAGDLYREKAEIHAAIIRNHCSMIWGLDDEEEEEEEEEEKDRIYGRWGVESEMELDDA
jgi:hypothetical protein